MLQPNSYLGDNRTKRMPILVIILAVLARRRELIPKPVRLILTVCVWKIVMHSRRLPIDINPTTVGNGVLYETVLTGVVRRCDDA